jgi:hypothetical protein
VSACVDAVRWRLSNAQSAAAVQAVLVAGNHLQPQYVLALAEQLGKFPALKRLDVSSNPRLRLLPVGLLQMAATLEAFSCQGCSLVLPPQSFFSSVPEENPIRIRQLLQNRSSDTELTLSSVDLASAVVSEVAALLKHYPFLKRLDVSCNPKLRLRRRCCGFVGAFRHAPLGRPFIFRSDVQSDGDVQGLVRLVLRL